MKIQYIVIIIYSLFLLIALFLLLYLNWRNEDKLPNTSFEPIYKNIDTQTPRPPLIKPLPRRNLGSHNVFN